jgi:hypothetical protein
MTAEEIASALDAAAGHVLASPVQARRGRPKLSASWEEAFSDRTVAVEGGHLHWSGATGARGTPVLAFGGQVETAYRLAFRWHYGREPQGNVRPTCHYPCCVAGGHLADRMLREGGGA